MLVNKANLAGLTTGFMTIFNGAFNAVTPTYTMVAMEVPSSTSENAYPWLGKMKGMREWLGDRQLNNLVQHGFKIANKDFENTVTVDRTHIEDDQVGVYSPLFADLGQTAAEHPDELVWPLLKNGFDTECYDGQYFFDTDHPITKADGTAGVVSNFQGGSGTPWFLLDTSRVIKPIIFQKRKPAQFVALDRETDENVFMRKQFIYGVDGRWNAGYGLWQLAYASKETLNTANFNSAVAAFMAQKGDGERLLNTKPTLLVVPPSYRATALEIAQAERLANGQDNVNKGLVKVHVETRLA